MSSHFMKYVFLSKHIEIQIEIDSKKSTVTNLHLEKISSFMFPCPSRAEQEEIENYLDKLTSLLDSLNSTATSAITLLQERRAALISAAVTGKIDVRDLVPADPSASAA